MRRVGYRFGEFSKLGRFEFVTESSQGGGGGKKRVMIRRRKLLEALLYVVEDGRPFKNKNLH